MPDTPKRLFLLDGMALIYRAHFAFIRSPRITSTGLNTSALFGYLNTVLDIVKNHAPTHLAVAFDTPEPTRRHREFPAYKAQREAMPDELRTAIPHVFALTEALRIPVLRYPGYEADDVIGTLARQAEAAGFEVYMVTGDKDFAQLVTDRCRMLKPAKDGAQLLGPAEILRDWEIERVEQVIDVLGLMGDTADNVPGVPGIGEKTAKKLIAQFGSIEALLARTAELKGKQRENLEQHAELARLSRHLVTIDLDVPVTPDWDAMALQPPDRPRLEQLCTQFEFVTLGKRLLGEEFNGGAPRPRPTPPPLPLFAAAEPETAPPAPAASDSADDAEAPAAPAAEPDLFAAAPQDFRRLPDVPHRYSLLTTPAEAAALAAELLTHREVCFDTETTGTDARQCELVGIGFCARPGEAAYLAFPADPEQTRALLAALAPFFTAEQVTKVGHNLKFDLTVLAWQGCPVSGPLADTMIAHYLLAPDQRHGMDELSRQCLGYDPIPITALIGPKGPAQRTMREVEPAAVCDYCCEDADVTLRLWHHLRPQLTERNAERIFFDLEMPLLPVLIAMESAGICLDRQALDECSRQMAAEIAGLEQKVYELAGGPFNMDSPRQLGEVLFDRLALDPKAKRTGKTGQYATSEQVLQRLAGKHEIVRAMLDYRQLRKLLSTYVDALPQTILPRTGRVHTTFNQAVAATGRLASTNPNLQNIPIRSERGREVRKAFIASGPGWQLLSADYSQIELRIIAHMSEDAALLAAFQAGHDIHAATAARVFQVALEAVTPEMRSKAKMVNYGLAYGMSAFGLAQRLNISNREAAEIVSAYNQQFPGVQGYMERTLAFGREHGFVETLLGRRRYVAGLHDANATMRQAAERNAINAPIQGTAADLIKLAMIRIHRRMTDLRLRSRLLLQVHDELLFDAWLEERETLVPLVRDEMQHALPMRVPIVVDLGFGDNWLQAH